MYRYMSYQLLQDFLKKQKYFTHVLGYKQRLRDNPKEADDFCHRCASRLMNDFPAFTEKIIRQEWANRYFKYIV